MKIYYPSYYECFAFREKSNCMHFDQIYQVEMKDTRLQHKKTLFQNQATIKIAHISSVSCL